MTNAAAVKTYHSLEGQARAVAREVNEAQEILQASLSELDKILAQPLFNAAALTSVRLKLAGIRLTRGPLITKVAELLAGHVSESEAVLLGELQASHYRLLQIATAHTGKWPLDAIARDWPTYRRETRELVRKWTLKADRERRLVLPLIERVARSR